MPRQEVFFEQRAGDRSIEVVKIYDRTYAREVFDGLDEEATKALAASLELERNYEPEDIPAPNDLEYDDFLWEELCEAAKEDVRMVPVLYSFFVVAEARGGRSNDLFISPDWPSAEAYAKARIIDAG